MTVCQLIKYIINGGGMVHELPLVWVRLKRRQGVNLYILKETIIWGGRGDRPLTITLFTPYLPHNQSLTYNHFLFITFCCPHFHTTFCFIYPPPSPGLFIQHFVYSSWLQQARRVGAVVVRVGVAIMSDNSLARYLYTKMCHNTLITHFVKKQI